MWRDLANARFCLGWLNFWEGKVHRVIRLEVSLCCWGLVWNPFKLVNLDVEELNRQNKQGMKYHEQSQEVLVRK